MRNPHKKINRGRGKFIINIYNTPPEEKTVDLKQEIVNEVKHISWYRRLIGWIWGVIISFFRWLWSHPKKLITSALAGLLLWLSSFFPFKLPSFPFLPKLPTIEKQNENPKKSEETQKQDSGNTKPDTNNNKPTNSVPSNDDVKITTKILTNTVTQTNIVSQTNYVTETKYVTNFVIQPIVVTNTVYKEVPITVTNVLVIKNSVSSSDTNNNKNSVITGPAFYFTDDFNTLLQNQQQNPVRTRPLN
jgi:hypothetical protein